MPDTDTKIGFIGLGIMGAPMAANLAEGRLSACRPQPNSRQGRGVRFLGRRGRGGRGQPEGGRRAYRCGDHDAARLTRRRAGVPGRRRRDRRRAGGAAADRHELDRAVGGAGGFRGRRSRWGRRLWMRPSRAETSGARDGTLSIMVGGPSDAFERARPLFDVLGKTDRASRAVPALARPQRPATRSSSRSRSRRSARRSCSRRRPASTRRS